jgi:hypothetical protein
VFAARGKNLFFSADPKKYIAEADMVFVSVNTCVFPFYLLQWCWSLCCAALRKCADVPLGARWAVGM